MRREVVCRKGCGPAALVFAAALAVCTSIHVKMRLVPDELKRRRVGRLAYMQFYRQGLHATRGRAGVLVLVSLLERKVEILADRGINEKVSPDTWDRVVREITSSLQVNDIASAFVTAIDLVTTVLEKEFPHESGKPNELRDGLIEL